MLVFKIILFVIAAIFLTLGIIYFNSSKEELGIPFIVIAIGSLTIGILLCLKLYFVSKIILSILAGLLLIYGIYEVIDYEKGIGKFCIIFGIITGIASIILFKHQVIAETINTIFDKLGNLISEHPFIDVLLVIVIIFCSMKFSFLNCIFGILTNIISILLSIFVFMSLKEKLYESAILIGLNAFFVVLMDMGADGVEDDRRYERVWEEPIRVINKFGTQLIQESHLEKVGSAPIINFFFSLLSSAIISAIITVLLYYALKWSVIAGIILVSMGIIFSLLEIIRFIRSLFNV